MGQAYRLLLTLVSFIAVSCYHADLVVTRSNSNQIYALTGPSLVQANECSSAFKLTLKDINTDPILSKKSLDFELSSGGLGLFYSDGLCTSPISDITLNALTSESIFYYKSAGYDGESPTITAKHADLDQLSYNFSVTEVPLFEVDTDFAISGVYSNPRVDLDYLSGLELDQNSNLVQSSVVKSGGNAYSYISRVDTSLGSIDTSFNTVGELQVAYGGTETYISTPRPEASGKIISTGPAGNASGDWQIVLTRTNADGSLDPSFGSSGVVDSNICGSWCWGWDVIKEGLHYYVTAHDSLNKEETVLFRLDDNGVYDAAYGTHRFDPSTGTYLIQSGRTIRSNGTHLFALYLTHDDETTNTTNYYICKYLISDGSRDAGFGGNGCLGVDGLNTSKHGLGYSTQNLFFSSDGNFLFLIMRYQDKPALAKIAISDGSMETAFGLNGFLDLSEYDTLAEVTPHNSLGLIILGEVPQGGRSTYAIKVLSEGTGASSSNSRISDTFIGDLGTDNFLPFYMEIVNNELYISGILYSATPEEIIQKLKINL